MPCSAAPRDLVTTILEANITIQGNRMNLIMKKVTSWAAIIAVPTAITGFYGQNVHNPGCPASSTSPSKAKTGCESWIRMTARAGHSLFIREPAGYP